MSSKNFAKRIAIALCATILAFFVFYVRAEFYVATNLTVQGVATLDRTSTLQVELDSGSGFSDFRKKTHEISEKDFVPGGNQGAFTTKILLPYQRIKKIKISGQSAVTISEVVISASNNSENLFAGNHELSTPLVVAEITINREAYNIMLFFGQLLAALLVGYVTFLLSLVLSPINQTGVRRWLRQEQGLYLVLMVLISCAVHCIWLLGYWPAQMTNDSWATVSDVAALHFADWHPYVYSMYVLVLFQFYPSVATVALFQIVMTSVLVCSILYFCLRRGVSSFVVAIFFFLFVCSIPIGLMNTIIWKDVPFSLAILALSFFCFAAQLFKKNHKSYVQIPSWQYPILACVIIAACHMRHNGIMFYAILPFLFVASLRWRDLGYLTGFLLLSFLTLNVWVPSWAHIQKTKGSPYHEVKTALAIMTHPNFYSVDREQDYKIMERYLGMPWSQVSQIFAAKWFTINDTGVAQHQYKPDLGYTEDGFNKKFLTRLISTNLPIFLSERTFGFFHSLAIDVSASDNRNGYFENPVQLTGSNLWPPGNFIFNHAIDATHPFPWLTSLVSGVDKWGRSYNGLISPQVLIWNLAIPFTLFCLIFFIEKFWSPITLFLIPNMAVAGGIFIVGAGESWRYFYYIYLAGIVVIPLYLAQRETLKRV